MLWLICLSVGASAQNKDSVKFHEKAMKMHQKGILVDTHNDILSIEMQNGVDWGKLQPVGNFDLVRAKQGGLDGQVFSIYCGESYGNGTAYKFANLEIDSLYSLIARYPKDITLVRNSKELKKA